MVNARTNQIGRQGHVAGELLLSAEALGHVLRYVTSRVASHAPVVAQHCRESCVWLAKWAKHFMCDTLLPALDRERAIFAQEFYSQSGKRSVIPSAGRGPRIGEPRTLPREFPKLQDTAFTPKCRVVLEDDAPGFRPHAPSPPPPPPPPPPGYSEESGDSRGRVVVESVVKVGDDEPASCGIRRDENDRLRDVDEAGVGGSDDVFNASDIVRRASLIAEMVNIFAIVLCLHLTLFTLAMSLPLWLTMGICLAYFVQRYGALLRACVVLHDRRAEARDGLAQATSELAAIRLKLADVNRKNASERHELQTEMQRLKARNTGYFTCFACGNPFVNASSDESEREAASKNVTAI